MSIARQWISKLTSFTLEAFSHGISAKWLWGSVRQYKTVVEPEVMGRTSRRQPAGIWGPE
jgi:hypothetical protein